MTNPTRIGISNGGKPIDLDKAGVTDEEYEELKSLKAPLSIFIKVIETSNDKYPAEYKGKEAQDKYMQKHIALANLIWSKSEDNVRIKLI